MAFISIHGTSRSALAKAGGIIFEVPYSWPSSHGGREARRLGSAFSPFGCDDKLRSFGLYEVDFLGGFIGTALGAETRSQQRWDGAMYSAGYSGPSSRGNENTSRLLRRVLDGIYTPSTVGQSF